MSKFYLVILLFFIASCSSINHGDELIKSYNSSFKVSSSSPLYKAKINIYKDKLIIQVYQSILGNLVKIEFSKNGNIRSTSFLESSVNVDQYLSNDYFKELYECFNKRLVSFDDDLIRINCDEFGNIKLDIKNSHYYIQGKISS